MIMSVRTPPFDIGWVPEEVENLNGWSTALTYVGEKRHSRLFLTDLSHLPKWALHGKDLDDAASLGLRVPPRPGEVRVDGEKFMVRLSPTECLITVFRGETPAGDDPAMSDMAEAYAAFAVVGSPCLEVLKRLSPVDLEAPGQGVPCAAQAPIHDLRCVIVRLEGREAIPGLIILGDRGYGQFLLDVFLDAGREFGISPGGWNRFAHWLMP
jgi:sarcosine oxidase gamma subunit